MAKANKQSPSAAESPAKRYRSMAEIKRDLFPNAAAEDQARGLRRRNAEGMMDEFFGPRGQSTG